MTAPPLSTPALLSRHLATEQRLGGIHPQGCFHCGAPHPSDCCTGEVKGEYRVPRSYSPERTVRHG